jgi:hypothetical protein
MTIGAFLVPLMLSTLKCWNLGQDAPSELRLEDLENEKAGREGDNAKDAEEATFLIR